MVTIMRSRPSRAVLAFPSGRFLLGAITAEQATETVFPASKVRGSAGSTQAVRNVIVASAGAGQLLDAAGQIAYMPGTADCAGVSLLRPALTGTIGSLALKFAPQAAAAGGPIAGAVVLAIAGISELFSAIFSHHAAAIAKERSILCAAVPAANQTLGLIDQAVNAGQATPAQASSALDSAVSGFDSAVSGIIKGSDPTGSSCNAACVMLSELRAIVALKKSQYADLAAAQSAASGSPFASSSGASSVATSGGFSFLPWAAAGIALYLFLK
jgi:hypothetical protein